MKIHELKILEDFADAVYSGDKTFELRENDRGFQKGDHIKFIAIDSHLNIRMNHHVINDCEYEITYVINGWGLKENYVALAIKKFAQSKEEVKE